MNARRVRTRPKRWGMMRDRKHDRVPANKVTHQKIAKVRKLVANERLGEEICNVEVRANVKDFEQSVTDIVSNVEPTSLQCLVVQIRRRVVRCENSALVVTQNRGGQCRTDLLQARHCVILPFFDCILLNETLHRRDDKTDFQQQSSQPYALVRSKRKRDQFCGVRRLGGERL